MANIESDFEFAQRLHREINGMAAGLDPGELPSRLPLPVKKINSKNKRTSIIEILSDESETEQTPQEAVVGRSALPRSRSPLHKVVSKVTFENQQAVTVNKQISVRFQINFCCCFRFRSSEKEHHRMIITCR